MTRVSFLATLLPRLCAGLLIPHRSSTTGLLVSLSPLLLVSPFTALLLYCSAALSISPSPAHADIFQWEYINPADPSQGKRQSTTIAPDGAGVDAVPGADLSNRNLTMAYLIGADLMNVLGFVANLTNADLSQANLSNANFAAATLTDADFTGADVRRAAFDDTTLRGFTAAQLYSTASYQALELTGISFQGNDLSGWNFAGLDLADANFAFATLTGADLTGAEIQRTYFGRFMYFGTTFGTGLTLAQLYATASYQAKDLSGVGLGYNNLVNGNFARQNLANVNFEGAMLSGANFREANLTNAIFVTPYSCIPGYGCDGPYYATLTGADFTGADARGASDLEFSDLSGATTANLIWPDGHIAGLDLDATGLLVVRDYDGYHDSTPDYPFDRDETPPIPITVDEHLTMGPGGTLQMVFEADAWDSTVSFAPGIPVALGGTLELTFAEDVNLASQLGRTLKIFDWTGVDPAGQFTISSPHLWDLSQLYTTGEVTLAAVGFLPGDYNGNGVVDAADYTVWRNHLGRTTLVNRSPNLAGPVGLADYSFWKSHFGQTSGSGSAGASPSHTGVPEPPTFALAAVPEPSTLVLAIMTMAASLLVKRSPAPARWPKSALEFGRQS